MVQRFPRSKRGFTAIRWLLPPPTHSSVEQRMIAVGRTESGRPIFVAFTMRNKNGRYLIRPVSARYMHAKEIKAFEEKSP
jgi:uncharacterized DUF497 family protein